MQPAVVEQQAVAGAEGVEYLTSSSMQSTSTVQAYIRLNDDPNRAMTDVMAKGGDAAARAFAAMMEMKKIDVARIEAAIRG